MTENFKIIIEYDGTPFFGWQRQSDKPTVQEELEKALSKILNQEIRVAGSGRTDAGVHALGQTANFHAETKLELSAIVRGVNSIIKQPIVIHKCEKVDTKFHSQYDAVSKEYHYYILNRKIPCAINRQYQWHIIQQLDIDVMNECCRLLLGEKDFKSFENKGSPRSSTIRTVYMAEVDKKGDRLIFKISASGFLKYMVRNITGTLVQAGLHKITTLEFKKIFTDCDRTKAGPTAPAHGLFLMNVDYK